MYVCYLNIGITVKDNCSTFTMLSSWIQKDLPSPLFFYVW